MPILNSNPKQPRAETLDELGVPDQFQPPRKVYNNKMSHLRSTTPSRNTSNTSGNENNPLLSSSGRLVSELEQEVLDEYARLLENVNKLGDALANLADNPASLTLDGLRLLERKTATVYTLLKASVYSIVLQQQIINDGEAAAAGGDGGYGYQHDESGLQGGDGDTVMR